MASSVLTRSVTAVTRTVRLIWGWGGEGSSTTQGAEPSPAPWLSAVIAERWEVSVPWGPGPCHFNFSAFVPGCDFQVNFMLGFLVWVISDLWRSPVLFSPALPWKVSGVAEVLPGHLPPGLGACPDPAIQGRQPQGHAGGEWGGSAQIL